MGEDGLSRLDPNDSITGRDVVELHSRARHPLAGFLRLARRAPHARNHGGRVGIVNAHARLGIALAKVVATQCHIVAAAERADRAV